MAPKKKTRSKKARKALADVPEQLAALEKMTMSQLHEVYFELFDAVSRSRNKSYLYKKCAHAIQERAEPLSGRAKARWMELAEGLPKRKRSSGKRAKATRPQPSGRDPRLPEPGTVVTRTFDGVEHCVTVLANEFEYQGELFPSLSKIARVISGTNWNGFTFFGLQKRRRVKA